MKTKKKAKKSADKWIEDRPSISKLHYIGTDVIYDAYMAGYMAEEEITPGTWKVNPGHQPDESIGKIVDILWSDRGIVDNVKADYQKWGEEYIDTIIEWRIHDE